MGAVHPHLCLPPTKDPAREGVGRHELAALETRPGSLGKDQKGTQEGKKLWEEVARAVSKSLPTPPWNQHGCTPGATSLGPLKKQ